MSPLLLALLPFVLVFAAALAFYPKRTYVSGQWLVIQTLGPTLRFDLAKAEQIEAVDRDEFVQLGTVRVCGVGWPLRSYGWFWNRQLGFFLSLPTNYENLYLIHFPRRRLLVSLENSRDLLLQSTPR